MQENERIKPQTNDIEIMMLNSIYSTNESEGFYKVDNNCHLKEGGQSAQVLFKKKSKKKPQSEPKVVIIKSNSTIIMERERTQTQIPKLITINTSNETKKQNQTPKNVSNQNDKKNATASTGNNKEKELLKEQKRKETKDFNQPSTNNTHANNEQTHYSTMKKVKVNNYIENKSNENDSSEKKPVTTSNNTTKFQKQNRNAKTVQLKLEEPKENKQEKRKQYTVPPVKIRKDKSMSMTDNNSNIIDNASNLNQEEIEQKKKEKVQNLMYNQEKLCIYDYQKQEQQLLKKKEYKEIEKKLKYLEQNDIDVDELVNQQMDVDDDNNDEAEEINQREQINNPKKKQLKNEEVIEMENDLKENNNNTEEYAEEEREEDDEKINFNPETIDQNDINIINNTTNENISNSKINHQYNHSKDKKINNNSNYPMNKTATISKDYNINHSKYNNKSDCQLTYSNTSNTNIKRSKSISEKEPKKPKIDTLEYLKQINQERDINPLDLNKQQINSFRKSSFSSNKKNSKPIEIKKVIQADSKTNFVYDEDNNFIYAYKNYQLENRDDIKQYMLHRRKESKEKAIKVQEEENTKHVKRLLALSKLQEIIEDNRRRNIQSLQEKKRVKNEYFIGAGVSHNNQNKGLDSTSTIVDLNDVLDNMVESNKIIASGMSDQIVNMKDQNNTSLMDQTNNSFRESMRKEIKDITNEAIKRGKADNKNQLIDSTGSIGKLKESLLEKVNNTVKRANELLCSDTLNQVLRSSFPKASFSNSINTVSDNELNEDKVGYDEDDIGDQLEHRNDNYIMETGEDEMQKNSIQVPSTIYQSNILSINPDKESEKQKKPIKIDQKEEGEGKEEEEEEEDEDIGVDQTDNNKQSIYFSTEDLEEYNDKFERFGEWFRMLNIRNCLNDIIIYGNNKLRYKLGIECLILLFKSNPFSVLDFYAKYNIYLNTLRGLFFPYLRRVLYDLINHQQDIQQKNSKKQTNYNDNVNEYKQKEGNQREKEQEKEEMKYEDLIQRQNDEDDDNNNEEHYSQLKKDFRSNTDNDIENKRPTKLIDERIAQNIKNGIALFRLPFIIYSMQKIAEYAYPDHNNQMSVEDIKYGEDSQNQSQRQSNSARKNNIKNNSKEDKMHNNNYNEDNNSNNNNSKRNLSGNRNQTYMYESFESKSSIVLYPNSEKSDRLHRVYELIGLQKDNMSNSFTATNNNIEDFNTSAINYNNISFNDNNDEQSSAKKSVKSTKSIGEIAKMKPGISLKNSMNSLKSKSNRSNMSMENEDSMNKSLPNEKNDKEINLPLSSTSSKNRVNPLNQQQEEQIDNNAAIVDNNQKTNERSDVNSALDVYKYENNAINNIGSNNTNLNFKIEKSNTTSEQDISVDKDSIHGIDWVYNVAGNKSSSDRDELKLKHSKETITKFISEQNINEPIKEDTLESASRELENNKNDITSKEKIEDEGYNDNNDESDYNENEFNQINLSDAINDNDNDDVNSFIAKEETQQRPEEDKIKAIFNKEPTKKTIDKANTEEKQSESKNSLNGLIPNIIPQTIESEESELIVLEKQDSKCFVIGDNTSLNSKELSMINLNTPNDNRSESSNITAIQNKTFVTNNYKELSNYNQRRYDEDDLKHHDIIQQEEPIPVDAFADILTAEIIKNILIEEISTNKHKLIPKKTQRIMNNIRENSNTSSLQMSNSGSYGGSSSPKRPMLQVNISANSIFNSNNNSNDNLTLNNSIFMKTIDDIKKEITLNLYNEKIAPKLIEEIGDEIDKNYTSIHNQIKSPYYCDVGQLIKGLTEKDDRLITLSKNKLTLPSKPFILKRDMLSSFNKINKNIRNDDNITSDNYYDNILNDCLIDSANEIIGAERIYGEVGLPLPWSNRTKHIRYKYENNSQSKERLINVVKEELRNNIEFKMGLIPENYDFMDVEQLSLDREKKFMKCIDQELHKTEDQWLNYEIEETQIKLVLSKIIFDQLLNEIVEILEHVHFSRSDPNKYQSKSIYACEDIPRLSFQNTTENDYQDHTNQ